MMPPADRRAPSSRQARILHLGRAAESGTLEAWLPTSVMGILAGGPEGLAVAERLAARHEAMEPASLTAKRAQGALLPPDTRLLAPVPSPGMILAAGLAYRSHLAEMSGTPTPTHPTAFLKSPSSISGPGATVTLPPQAPDHVDYEGELAVVIGRDCHALDAEKAMACIAGYTIANDLSARDWVKEVWAAEKPWQARQTWEVNIMGKQLPGFTALGPAIATAGRINDPNSLRLVTRTQWRGDAGRIDFGHDFPDRRDHRLFLALVSLPSWRRAAHGHPRRRRSGPQAARIPALWR